MDFIEQANTWAQGDAILGRIMMAIGIAALVSLIFIIRGDQAILKGMVIPLSLITLLGLGYGGFLGFSRIGHAEKAAALYQSNPDQAVSQELKKAERDNGNYTMIKKVWPALIVICALLLFYFKGDYSRGLLIGLLLLFVFGMMLDTFLHHHLEPYLKVLRELKQT